MVLLLQMREFMQIRRRGMKTEFLRSQYIPKKKASTQTMIGSQDYFIDRLEPELREKMGPEEIQQAEGFFKQKQQEGAATSQRLAVKNVASNIRDATKAIEDGQELSTDQAIAIYQAMDDLAKQLKRSGYPKSVVVPKKNKIKTTNELQTNAFSKDD
jgi:hypothetical protein